MSEEARVLLTRARVEYEDNTDVALRRFNEFNSEISRNLSNLGQYKTEVKDFSSAMKLAFEEPQRSMRSFISTFRLGVEGIKQGGQDAAIGISAVGLGLRGIVERIPGLRALAPAIDTASKFGNTLAKVFQTIRNRARGLENDFQILLQSISDQTETLRTQTEAIRLRHDQEIRSIRGLIAERRADIGLLKQQGNAEEEIAQKQTEILNLRLQLAKTQDIHRVESLLLRDVQMQVNQANQAMRRLYNTVSTGAGDGKKQIADMERALRNMSMAMDRAEKSGVSMGNLSDVYSKLSRGLAILKNRSEEAAQSSKKLATTSQQTTTTINKTTTSVNRMGDSFYMIQSSISNISPALSTVVTTVMRFGSSFTRAMEQAGGAAQKAGAAIQAGMAVAKGAFIAAGVAAVAFMKKTGLLATEVTTLEITMRQVARNLATKAGVDVEKFVAYIDTIPESLKGITTREALVATTSFLRGVPQLIGRIGELAEAAKNFGVTVADMSSSEVFGRFNEFIQSGNTALLKRLNIVTTATQMEERWAAARDIDAKSMTEQQKVMARFEGILKEVELTAGVYEEAMTSAGKQLSSMSRLTEQAGLVMGRQFEPILAKIIFGVNKFLEWFIELPPSVHQFIGLILKATAVLGALLAIVTAAGPALKVLSIAIRVVGKAIATSFPQLLAIGAAIGAIILAVKLFRRAWEENFGGIRDSIQTFVAIMKVAFQPLIDGLQVWGDRIGLVLRSIGEILTTFLIPAFDWLAKAVYRATGWISKALLTVKDVAFGSLEVVYDLLAAVVDLMAGEFTEASAFAEKALINLATIIALVFQKTIAKAADWGWNLVVTFANNMVKAATSVLAKVMDWIGGIIAKFWAPAHSPPAAGPLRYIEQWARGVMETYLRAFGLADFGILKDVMAPIQKALEGAVAAGTLGELDLVPAIQNVREQIGALLVDFRKTGQINEEIFTSISDTLGEGSKDLTTYIRKVLEHQQALDKLKKIQQQVTEAELAGFVPAELKKKLDAAQAEADSAQEAVNWQKEFLAAQQDTIDAQLRQLQLLQKMADAMDKIAAGKAGKGIGIEEPLKLEFPDVTPLEEGIKTVREGIGGVSQEFLDMRDKIQKAWDAFKKWIDLPFDEKLQSVLDWLTKITGIDWQPLIDGIKELDLTKISNWVEDVTGFNPLQWAQDTFGKAWDWIVEKTQWLYNTLVGESLIPELIDRINAEFERISILEKLRNTWKSIVGIWKIISAFLAPIANILTAPLQLIGSVISEIVKAIVDVWPQIRESLGELGGAFGELGEALAELWDAVKPLAIGLGVVLYAALTILSAVLTGAIKGISILVGAVAKAIPGVIKIVTGLVGFFTGAIRILTGVFLLLTGRWDEGIQMIGKAFDTIMQGARNVLTGLIEIITRLGIGIAEALLGFGAAALAKIVTFVADILGSLGILPEQGVAIIKEWAENGLKNFDDFKKKVDQWVTDAVAIFNGLLEQIDEIWSKLFGENGIITTWVATALENVKQFFVNLWKDLVGGSIIQDIYDDIEGIWNKIFGSDGWIATKVSDAIDAALGFVENLFSGLVGEDGIFTRLKSELSDLWDDIFGEEGFIRTKVSDAIDAIVGFGATIYNAGKGVIDSLFAGMRAAWDAGKEVLGKAWAWFENQLPGSEPKDPKSPFRGLRERGAAIVERLASGMAMPNLGAAFSAQMANAVSAMSQVPNTYNQNTRSFMMGEGSVVAQFPNVRNPMDAQGVMEAINNEVDIATLRRFRSGN